MTKPKVLSRFRELEKLFIRQMRVVERAVSVAATKERADAEATDRTMELLLEVLVDGRASNCLLDKIRREVCAWQRLFAKSAGNR